MSITLTPTQPRRVPEWIRDLVRDLRPEISGATQFVCLVENAEVFGAASVKDHLTVHVFNSEAVKTVRFLTDGQTQNTPAVHYADGSVVNRKITDFKYILIENAINGGDEHKLVQTVYVRDKQLYVELRKAVGLVGY